MSENFIDRIAEMITDDPNVIGEAMMGATSAPHSAEIARQFYNALINMNNELELAGRHYSVEVGLKGDQIQVILNGGDGSKHRFALNIQYAGSDDGQPVAGHEDEQAGSDPLAGNMHDQPATPPVDELQGGMF